MKKWLTFILLLITITGTFYPCCVVDGCNEEEIATSKKENNKEPEGNCSPFFACATCPGFAEMSKHIEIEQPVAINQVHHESALVFDLQRYSSSFWQPPRFC